MVACGVEDEAAGPQKASGPGAPVGNAAYVIEVSDAPEPLSANPSDRLFRIKLVKGASVAKADLRASAELQLKHVFDNVELDDANGNGTLDVGETCTVVEGGSNTFSETHASQSAAVGLIRMAKGDPSGGTLLAAGTWATK